MNQIKYIDSLTPLRGLAALWVMVFHIDVSLFYRDMGALVPREVTGIVSQGYLWVDFFFLLSGFIMMHVFGERLSSGGKVLDYLWARLARIYPLHLFCLGLVVVIAITYPLFVPQVKDGSWDTFMAWRAIPSNLLLTHAMNQHTYLSWDIVSWSIGAEWWTYVATIPLLIGLWRGPAALSFAAMAVGFALLCGLVLWRPAHTLDITFDWGFFRCLFEFVMGLGLYRIYREDRLKWVQHDAIAVSLLIAIAVIFHFKFNDLSVIPLFALLILSVSHSTGICYKMLQSPPLQYLGRISYSLYLVHGVVFSALWFLLPWIKTLYGPFHAPERLAYAIVFATIVIGLSSLTYHLVERPSRVWLMALRNSALHSGLS